MVTTLKNDVSIILDIYVFNSCIYFHESQNGIWKSCSIGDGLVDGRFFIKHVMKSDDYC